jgi:hypothetical protein
MVNTIGCLLFVMVTLNVALAQGWQGIVPLHASCEDVKQTLGIAGCQNTTYDLKEAMVSIAFSDGTCLSGWKVPAGTVLTLDIHPKRAPKFADLKVNETRYQKVADPHTKNVVYYKSKEDGISIAVFADETVAYIFYGPSSKDNYLRCQAESANLARSGEGHGSIKFDEYGVIDFKDEQERLDAFAIELRSWAGTQGYIIAYGGRHSRAKEAQTRASRAKDYLLKKRRIDKSRIVTVDGGYREESTIELYIRVKDGDPPVAFPTVPPSEMTSINNRKLSKNKRHSRSH